MGQEYPTKLRSEMLRVRLTTAERQQLRAMANAAGMTESAYVRHLIDTKAINGLLQAMVKVEVARMLNLPHEAIR